MSRRAARTRVRRRRCDAPAVPHDRLDQWLAVLLLAGFAPRVFLAYVQQFLCATLRPGDVVIADNLFQLLVGWEIMGVCSYLLIGHWYEDHANSSAAIKAFLTTRVGDVPFMFGIFACIFLTGMTTSSSRRRTWSLRSTTWVMCPSAASSVIALS